MKEIIFFRQPFRKFMIKITFLLKNNEKMYDWVLDNLYPDDAVVKFGDDKK